MTLTLDTIVSLAKRRGFVFPSSEIYGGIANIWDFGPLGVELKNNIKKAWWQKTVEENANIVGLDAAIIMNPTVWKASGHVDGFADKLIECKDCHHRSKAEDFKGGQCPECGSKSLTAPRDFNIMFITKMGTVEADKRDIYLRPETAQGIYVNYENVRQTMRLKVPFGIAQIGKAFRNEITPGNFIFRMREFEQMEMQYFVRPTDSNRYFGEWVRRRLAWYADLGINPKHIYPRETVKNELQHYAKRATDIHYDFPFGSEELEGIHNRSDYDLARHQKYSGKDLQYFDEEKKEKFLPHIVETSVGVERAFLAFLLESYTSEEVKGEKRVVLKLDRRLAPIKVAVLPLSKKEKLVKEAQKLFDSIKTVYHAEFDTAGSIGRRYRRQDEIGTPYCITVDFETLEDKAVTIRERDTMKQERIKVDKLAEVLKKKLGF